MQRSVWRKLFSAPPNKRFLRFWNKKILTGIYWNAQTFAFQVLRECNSWASRNGAVQMFFLEPIRNMFFLLCWVSIFFITLSELRFVKWMRFFEWNCIIKWVIFFASFCWLWDFLLENLKLVEKFQTWSFYLFIFWSKFYFWDCFRAF